MVADSGEKLILLISSPLGEVVEPLDFNRVETGYSIIDQLIEDVKDFLKTKFSKNENF